MKGSNAKPHIGIFGRRNNGKSSFINSLTGQDVAIVSDVAGTTTDPVKKSIEIPGIGPVVMIDTAGMDDFGDLGKKRVGKTRGMIRKIDLGVLLLSGNEFGIPEQELIDELEKWEVPYVMVHNKSDVQPLGPALKKSMNAALWEKMEAYSAVNPVNKEAVVRLMRKHIPETAYLSKSLVGDIIRQGDLVLLITPIDDEAPEGRLILPQVQSIRDILDNDAVAVVVKEREVDTLLKRLQPRPALAITDSQVFLKADASVPHDIPLTSFSTVLARYKGDFQSYLKGTPKLSDLKSGDKVLILESCTHHVSCDDIGRVKIPRWLSQFSGASLEYQVVSGLDDVPGVITDYQMVIQCGGCVITRKQLVNRLKPAVEAGIPVTNYGMAIAWMQGIYKRAIAPFTGESADSAVNYL
ncbi:MAG TPA: [FeFe] hydrogenase H-cluster maturation GTPase HydF [Bacteroidales bacterium]|nr:[FeFe] hydrogenase H-cluster maturation GTPase HydF [Bacteroidales bacterium]